MAEEVAGGAAVALAEVMHLKGLQREMLLLVAEVEVAQEVVGDGEEGVIQKDPIQQEIVHKRRRTSQEQSKADMIGKWLVGAVENLHEGTHLPTRIRIECI